MQLHPGVHGQRPRLARGEGERQGLPCRLHGADGHILVGHGEAGHRPGGKPVLAILAAQAYPVHGELAGEVVPFLRHSAVIQHQEKLRSLPRLCGEHLLKAVVVIVRLRRAVGGDGVLFRLGNVHMHHNLLGLIVPGADDQGIWGSRRERIGEFNIILSERITVRQIIAPLIQLSPRVCISRQEEGMLAADRRDEYKVAVRIARERERVVPGGQRGSREKDGRHLPIHKGGEGIGRAVRPVDAIHPPAAKHVALAGHGGEGDGFARRVIPRSGDRAALSGVGCGGDGIAVLRCMRHRQRQWEGKHNIGTKRIAVPVHIGFHFARVDAGSCGGIILGVDIYGEGVFLSLRGKIHHDTPR